MRSLISQTVLVLASTFGLATAGTPVIGIVTAGGAFRLNGETIIANGTLTEGVVLETGRGISSIRLAGGARLSLSPDSRGKLYSDRIILEKGETRLDNGIGFHLEALGLTIRPDRGISTGRIGLLGSNRVRVSVLTGSFRVLNARGLLVANIGTGIALAFEPQTPAAAAVTHITGTLTEHSGHFLLTDQVTNVTVEVTGQGLEPHVGTLVQVTGTMDAGAAPVAGASQVVATTSVQAVSAGATAGGAVGGGAAAAGVGGASVGPGVGIALKTVTIVGGVTAAATLGGLAANGAPPPQAKVSR